MGVRSRVGLTAASFAAAVRGGICRVADHPFMVDRRGNPVPACLDANLDPRTLGAPRISALARSALAGALQDVPAGMLRSGSFELLLALPEARPGFSAEDAASVAREA